MQQVPGRKHSDTVGRKDGWVGILIEQTPRSQPEELPTKPLLSINVHE
jgi:hypothetical protein